MDVVGVPTGAQRAAFLRFVRRRERDLAAGRCRRCSLPRCGSRSPGSWRKSKRIFLASNDRLILPMKPWPPGRSAAVTTGRSVRVPQVVDVDAVVGQEPVGTRAVVDVRVVVIRRVGLAFDEDDLVEAHTQRDRRDVGSVLGSATDRPHRPPRQAPAKLQGRDRHETTNATARTARRDHYQLVHAMFHRFTGCVLRSSMDVVDSDGLESIVRRWLRQQRACRPSVPRQKHPNVPLTKGAVPLALPVPNPSKDFPRGCEGASRTAQEPPHPALSPKSLPATFMTMACHLSATIRGRGGGRRETQSFEPESARATARCAQECGVDASATESSMWRMTSSVMSIGSPDT